MAHPARPDRAADAVAAAVAEAKTELRRAVHARRRERLATDPAAVAAAGVAVRDRLLDAPEIAALRPGSTVAAYLELRSEVPAAAIRAALVAAGIRVVVPILLPDGDLDWAVLDRGDLDGAVAPGPPGTDPGAGAERPRLGPEAITGVAVVLLPGTAADPRGHRLGRGGGSYDRSLSRLAAAAPGRRPWTCVLLFDDEVVAEVPSGAHDVEVDAVVTPGRLLRTVGTVGAD